MTDTEQFVQRILADLRKHKNVLLYGPPGCGKTYLMSKIRNAFMDTSGSTKFDEGASIDFFKEGKDPESWWITFHQSYAYEDFVVGLRTQAGQGFHVEPQAGPFLEASAHAADPDCESLILIDEINRGNTSRAFGELITLMESDKRSGGEHEINVDLPIISQQGLELRVPRSNGTSIVATVPRRFSLSPRLHVLASMNSVDRTVAPLDAALRRRFYVIELRPDYNLLRQELGLQDKDEDQLLEAADDADIYYWRALAVVVLEKLNARIQALSGSDVQLGHSYLWPLIEADAVETTKTALASALQFKIVPQVEELYRGSDELISVVLAAPEPGSDATYPVTIQDAPAEVAEVGGRNIVRFGNWSSGDLNAHLRRLAGIEGHARNP